MKYEYLIFDMDDTLIDNVENVRYAYKKMMEFMGEEYSDDGFKDWLSFDKQFWDDYRYGLIEVPEEYKLPQELYVKYVQSLRYMKFFDNKLDISEAFKLNDLFLNSLKEVVVEVSGAKEVLKELSLKYKIVVATNGPRQAVYTKIDKIGCSDYVNYVFAADMTKSTVTKPNVKYFEELEEFLNFTDRDKMLLIGDSLKCEVQGGMNSGIDSCWLDRGEEKLTDKYKPTYVIKELKELLEIL